MKAEEKEVITMNKEGFVIYKSFYKPISRLSDKQLGRLFRAIFEYNISGVVSVEGDIEMAFEFFKNQFDIDEGKYQSKVERNRENGRRGGIQRAANKQSESSERYQTLPIATESSERYRNQANQADKEKDKEKDKDKDNNPPIIPLGDSDNDDGFTFDKFWSLYDKKVGDKEKIKRKWEKLPKKDKEKIFEYIPKYIQAQPDKKYRKNPETFLNNSSWNDELIFQGGQTIRSDPSKFFETTTQYTATIE
jgi:hypothetical protein